MKRDLKHFILRTLVATLPIIAFIGMYAALDPFKVIHRYDEMGCDSVSLGGNRGFESVKSLERNLAQGRHYDSFIFGSSMSQAYKAEYWQPHLPAGASIFHFDASEETIDGIIDKIEYLNHRGIKIANALIIIEEEMLHRLPNDQSFLFARPSETSSDVSWLQFQMQFFNTYKNIDFVCYSIAPRLWQKTMLKKDLLSTDKILHVDSINEVTHASADSLIAVNPEAFFTEKRLKHNSIPMLPRNQQVAIDSNVETKVARLAQLLKAGGKHYEVIVIPRLNRNYLMQWDLTILQEYLGIEHVHDMTRHPLSNNPLAYYDQPAHMICTRCKEILDEALAPTVIFPQNGANGK